MINRMRIHTVAAALLGISILETFRLKAGQYRKEAQASLNVTEEDIVRLEESAWIKRNKAGAVSLTSVGKDALETTRI